MHPDYGNDKRVILGVGGCVRATDGKLATMDATESHHGDMTWWDYVQQHAAGAPNSHIAQAVGITPPSVGRWSKPGGRPDPAQAAAFARAYGRPVLEAFIAAGFLTSQEAGEKPSAPPALASLSDDDLLDEVRRRMKGGASWSGSTSPEDEGQAGSVIDGPWGSLGEQRPAALEDEYYRRRKAQEDADPDPV